MTVWGESVRVDVVLPRHLLAVFGGVEGRVGEENLTLARVHAEPLVKRVTPHVMHILPTLHHAVGHGIRHLGVGAERRGARTTARARRRGGVGGCGVGRTWRTV